jgi:molybdate transport system substrate-binding protein
VILHILSGGAAQGLVHALAPKFKTETGCDIDGTFGAVGAMREKLLAGAPADIVILTRALVKDLEDSGQVLPGSATDIGIVRTAGAVRQGDPAPAIGDVAAVRDALLAADGIYVPDLKLSTAGIHFGGMLESLGIRAQADKHLRVFPSGNIAMRELASAGGRPIGCTQVTEILNTPGVTLVGPLPKALELATVYTAGICRQTHMADLARRFATQMAGAPERARFGFSASASSSTCASERVR